MKKHRRPGSLLHLVLFLLAINILLLPLGLHFSYAGSPQSPASTLTYTTGKLTWDSATGIRPDGTAELDFFEDRYSNVQSSQQDSVIAPGTGESRMIRLHNAASQTVRYKALVYRILPGAAVPLSCDLSADGAAVTHQLPALPEGVTEQQVVKAVEGSVAGGMVQDFTVDWSWPFERDADAEDTALGIQGTDQGTLGFYIVVVDDIQEPDPETEPPETTQPATEPSATEPQETHSPTDPDKPAEIPAQRPKTGDSAPLGVYATLVFVGLSILVLLYVTRRREAE